MVFYKSLVEKCIAKRQELDISYEGLSYRTNLDEETIRLFEEGSTKIPVEAFLKIIDTLKFDLTAISF